MMSSVLVLRALPRQELVELTESRHANLSLDEAPAYLGVAEIAAFIVANTHGRTTHHVD
jgi:hypothetical protein